MMTVGTVLVFFLGLILGSFLNVVIYRLPRGQSLVRPASRCPACGTPVRPLDNIPLLSFLLLRGRCRACRAPIGWRYPLVELAAGGLLVLIWARFGPGGSWAALMGAVLFSLSLLAVFFIDLDHRIVPNAITYPGVLVGLALALPQQRLGGALLAALAAGAFFLLIALVSRGGMGGGDIKLAAMMGAFLGWPGIQVGLLTAFVVGAVGGVTLIAMGKRSRKDAIPFGPALAVGGVVALLAGDVLLRWWSGP